MERPCMCLDKKQKRETEKNTRKHVAQEDGKDEKV